MVTRVARGFGRAIAQRLACCSAKLALWDVIEEEGNQAATDCREVGAEAAFFNCDMGSPNDNKTAAERVLDQSSYLYPVVNKVGSN